MQFVFDQRSAERAAEVVPLQLFLGLVRLLEKIVRGVQRVAAPGIEPGTVKPVPPFARDDVDLRAAGAAKFRTVAVAEDLEFFDRLERRVDENRSIRADIVVVRAVNGPHVRRHVAAAHREIGPAEQPLVLDVEGVGSADTRHQRGELQEITTVQRQLADHFSRDHARNITANRFDDRALARDRDDLAHLAGRQLEIEREVVGDAHENTRARFALEALQLGCDLVAPRRQFPDRVRADLIGDRRPREAGLFVDDCDRGARQDGLRRISDRAPDCGSRSLRVRRRRE